MNNPTDITMEQMVERIKAWYGHYVMCEDVETWPIEYNKKIYDAIIAALAGAGLTLPVSPEVIIAVLTAIVGILFKVKKPA